MTTARDLLCDGCGETMTTARELLTMIRPYVYGLDNIKAIDAYLAQPEPKPTNRDRELAKDAIAFLRLNDMHLAAGVVSKYVLGSTE